MGDKLAVLLSSWRKVSSTHNLQVGEEGATNSLYYGIDCCRM